MLATEVITEEWLTDVLDDSMEMDWTTVDGARAIMRALRAGLVQLPQSSGQIANIFHNPQNPIAHEWGWACTKDQ